MDLINDVLLKVDFSGILVEYAFESASVLCNFMKEYLKVVQDY
jgi:hypothetical protein